MKKVLLLLFFTAGQLLSQTNSSNQEKISKALSDYFQLDRENIFLHLNKQTYLSDEKIWFKAYVTEKKTNTPFPSTTNVFVSLTDASGNVLQTKLYYAESSLLTGTMSLPEKLPTGKYNLRVFTNFMNNFAEDESSNYAIYIIDPAQKNTINSAKVDYNTAHLELLPEGGIFLDGVSNTFAVRLTDCNGTGIPITDGQIKDASGNVAATFITNPKGYGRFDLIASKSTGYTAHCTLNGKLVQLALPSSQIKGVTFSVNSYTFADKVVVTAKTNPSTLAEIGKDAYTIVAGQEQDVAFAEFSFNDKSEVSVAIPSENFKPGVNSIYLIDKNQKIVVQRVIFKPGVALKKADITVAQKRGDSIIIKGISPLALGSMSVSVLPINNDDDRNSIVSSLLIDNFSELRLQDPAYYLDGFSRKKHYELDCFLMAQTPKYAFSGFTKMPEKKFEFDRGLTIKGTINTVIPDRKNAKVKMNSIAQGLDETTTIDEKNEFVFTNVIALDSTSIYFSVIDAKGKTIPAKIHSQLLNNNRRLIKNIQQTDCSSNLIESAPEELPTVANSVVLDAVTVAAQKKNKEEELNPQNNMRFGNSMAKGHKITDDVAQTYRFLTDFIQANGYHVVNTGATVSISRTYSTSILGSNSVVMYIDDTPIPDMSILIGYTMDMVDEVYFNRRGYGQGSNAGGGVIRIYTRRTTRGGFKSPNSTWQELKIQNAYQRLSEFKTPNYANVQDAGFKKYGTIAWLPNVNTDEKGEFKFAFPNLQQQKVKLVIEGIDGNGQLYSETRLLDL
ncbi:MAG: hypothetical protein EOO50_06425 [Flavobacterium sp.]|uniref:hypothetical protein n=1 Tax=Flavobacterium sp. TaxID=239 RepID=UPI0011F5FA9E|nr:hypothetical protein [Flavobacterium sp.]RZJ67153.1 MAG: hypothetical protein EOO50_06425 [Flavobacterium sp.]